MSHLEAFTELFPLKSIRVFGQGRENIDKLCQLAESMSLTAVRCESGNEAAGDADIIVSSVTYASNLIPFMDSEDLKPGSFTTITDLGTPWIKERFSAYDCLVIDDLEQEEAAPNKLCSRAHISGDLSGLVLREFKGRRNATDRTAFLFRGFALGDLALSVLALSKSGLFPGDR